MDLALANKMVALATAADARCKRQAAACAQTQAMIVEIEAAIKAEDDAQAELALDEARTKDAPPTPPRRRS